LYTTASTASSSDGYLSGLSRPEQVVYFLREVTGVPVVDKAVLSKRTGEYRGWVEAFARYHKIPMEWAQKAVRKEDYIRPGWAAWSGPTGMASISSSKAWSKGRPFAVRFPSFPPKIPTPREIVEVFLFTIKGVRIYAFSRTAPRKSGPAGSRNQEWRKFRSQNLHAPRGMCLAARHA